MGPRAATTTVEITRVEDVRAGDRVTLTCNDTTVVGTVRDVAHGDATHIDIATLPCVLIVGGGHWWTFVRATREAPALPTEPGSVIVSATIRRVEGQTAILDPDEHWLTTVCVEDHWYHYPEHITAWEPGRIVPEGGAS